VAARATRWHDRDALSKPAAVTAALATGLLLVAAAGAETSGATANPNPCALVPAAQISSALAIPKPRFKLTTGGFPGQPVLVCTYSWGANTLVIRLISSGTESASGGVRETGMGAHGLLIVSARSTWVAFIKAGWSVWLIATPPQPSHGVVLVGQAAYRNLH